MVHRGDRPPQGRPIASRCQAIYANYAWIATDIKLRPIFTERDLVGVSHNGYVKQRHLRTIEAVSQRAKQQ